MNAAARLLAMAAMTAASLSMAQEGRPDAPTLPAAPTAPPPRNALPDKETIRAAVRQIVAERVAEQPAMPRRHAADTLRANQYDVFARKVEEATVPDCLHAEGLKRQPTFFITGFYALPFIAVAKLRGVCQ